MARSHSEETSAALTPDAADVIRNYTRQWTVSYRHRSGGGPVTSTFLTSPDAVRQRYAFADSKAWLIDAQITEHTTAESCKPIPLDALPGEGHPTPAPQTDDAGRTTRHYRCTGLSPRSLPTGDDVREHLKWLAKNGPAYGVDPSTIRVLDVALTRTSRQINITDLPTA